MWSLLERRGERVGLEQALIDSDTNMTTHVEDSDDAMGDSH